MRALLPDPGPVEPFAAHARLIRPAPADRPWVAVNMVTSVDGAVALRGASAALSGPADKVVFGALRAVADVILVAAGTVRADRYRAPRTAADRRAERTARGQASFPRLAVVSRSLDLDPNGPLFTDLPTGPEVPEPPLIYTVNDAPASRRLALDNVAEVVDAGEGSVAVGWVLEDLRRRGVALVLAEGGPTLLGHLLTAGCVDEFNLTTSPILAGVPSRQALRGTGAAVASMGLAHLWEADGFLFARYVRGSSLAKGTQPSPTSRIRG